MLSCPSYPLALQDFYHEEILDFVKDLSASDDSIIIFLSSSMLMVRLHLLIYVFWNIPVSLVQRQLYQGE